MQRDTDTNNDRDWAWWLADMLNDNPYSDEVQHAPEIRIMIEGFILVRDNLWLLLPISAFLFWLLFA